MCIRDRIGADLRKPKIQESFNVDPEKGLSNYLINKAKLKDIITKSKINNLDVISSGPTPPNPSELLESKNMSQLIEKLNNEYDFVIIDTPPIGLVTDGAVLMKKADINLFIVRHGFTKIKSLSIINTLHQQNIIKNINIVINDYKYNNAEYGYGYGYGYGYNYGGDGYYQEN